MFVTLFGAAVAASCA